MSQALISSSLKLVTVLIKEEIQWNDRARRGNLIQKMLLFLTLFHSAKKHLLNYFLFATWSKNTVRYTENYALKKQAASLTLKTRFADDSKQHTFWLHLKQKPPSIPISETVEPGQGLDQHFHCLYCLGLYTALAGMTVRLLTVFLLLQTISQMLTYIPSMFHMGSGLQDQLSTQSATDIYLW